jgi:ABC-type sugar transport system, periplasmic component
MKKYLLAIMFVTIMLFSVFASYGNTGKSLAATPNLAKIYAAMKTDPITLSVIKASKANKKFKIGLAMCNVSTEWYRNWSDVFQAEVKAAGAVPLMATSENDATKQVSQIENFLAQKVDALMIVPADPLSALDIVVQKAYDQGVPVFAADMPLSTDAKYMSAFLTDAYHLGYSVGEEIAKRLLAENPAGDIEYGLIGGVEGNPVPTARDKGMRDAIKKVDTQGRIKEVAFLYAGDYSEESGLKVAENMLIAHPKIKAILGTCDAHAIGAAAAAKRQGLDKNIIMGGVDGSKPAMQIMKNGGPIKALGLNSSYDESQLAARSIIAFLNKGTLPPSKTIYLKPILITPQNVDSYLK